MTIETTRVFNIEIELLCYSCGKKLNSMVNVREKYRSQKPSIFVEQCPDCAYKIYEAGRKQQQKDEIKEIKDANN